MIDLKDLLRIRRSWKWESIPNLNTTIGGKPPAMRLLSKDTVEYRTPAGTWEALPVVEDPIPADPSQMRLQQQKQENELRIENKMRNIREELLRAAKGENNGN